MMVMMMIMMMVVMRIYQIVVVGMENPNSGARGHLGKEIGHKGHNLNSGVDRDCPVSLHYLIFFSLEPTGSREVLPSALLILSKAVSRYACIEG